MRIHGVLWGIAALLGVSLPVVAAEPTHAVSIANAWVEPGPQGDMSHLHASITNTTSSALVVGGFKALSATRTSMLTFRRNGRTGFTQMETVPAYLIGPAETLTIEPNSNDVRLIDLTADFDEGRETAIQYTVNGDTSPRTLRVPIGEPKPQVPPVSPFLAPKPVTEEAISPSTPS